MSERTNAKRLEKSLRRLKSVLPEGMHFEYEEYDFSDGRPDYATLNLISSQELEYDLEEAIRTSLGEVNSGVRADMRIIDRHESGDGKHVYVAEIVPLEDVLKEDWASVTEDYLHRLPKALKEFWMKRGKRK